MYTDYIPRDWGFHQWDGRRSNAAVIISFPRVERGVMLAERIVTQTSPSRSSRSSRIQRARPRHQRSLLVSHQRRLVVPGALQLLRMRAMVAALSLRLEVETPWLPREVLWLCQGRQPRQWPSSALSTPLGTRMPLTWTAHLWTSDSTAWRPFLSASSW